MHLLSCEHPKVVYNQYSKEYITVPCRHCDYCRNAYQLQWKKRIEYEMQCNKYVVFFTLTYNEESVPLLQKIDDNTYFSLSIQRKMIIGRNRNELVRHIDDNYKIEFDYDSLSDDDKAYIDSREMIPVCRKQDIQDFVKRVRSYISYYNNLNGLQDEKIRYFVVSEYGPTTFRPHYHGLFFFKSAWTAKNFNKILHSSWKNGFVNWSFAKQHAAGYVAKYVTGASYLPAVYQNEKIRPFFLCSRKNVIGSRVYPTKEIREVIKRGTPKYPVYDVEKKSYVDVPLPRTLEGRWFPKTQGFGTLNHYERVTLYGLGQSFFDKVKPKYTFEGFKAFIESHYVTPAMRSMANLNQPKDFLFGCNEFTIVNDDKCTNVIRILYNIGVLYPGKNGDYPSLRNLYYTIRRFDKNRLRYGFSIESYVSYIEKYYSNKAYEKLKEQLQFEVEYADKFPAYHLINLDLAFKKRLLTTPYWHGSDALALTAEGFGIYSENLCIANNLADDSAVRLLDYHHLKDYVDMCNVHSKIAHDSMKVKKKNDSLNYQKTKNVLTYE